MDSPTWGLPLTAVHVTLPSVLRRHLAKPAQVGEFTLTRVQALWLSKRMDCDTDAAATALVNQSLGGQAITRRTVDGWKTREDFRKALELMTRDRARLWRYLAMVFYAPNAWDALGRLLTSDNPRAVKDGLFAYLKLAGVGEHPSDHDGLGIDPQELARELARPHPVQIVQVFRGREPVEREEQETVPPIDGDVVARS